MVKCTRIPLETGAHEETSLSADPKSDEARASVTGPIEVFKASELLAGRLREQILQGQLQEGAPLPTERDLGHQSGLGRSSVREALRILENQGFVSIRPGRGGGSIVQLPDRADVETSLEHFIRGRRFRLRALIETREAIEPASARLAARHRTSADIESLERLSAALGAAFDNIPEFLRVNIEWHLAVVTATHNDLLIAFMRAIAQAVLTATDLEDFNSDEVRTATLKIHRRILDAIIAGDEEAAVRRMRRHVGSYARLVATRPPESLEKSTKMEL
ncbi:MAG: FadR/GntR family transcriptional regulator [Beijerinckiaceae bacterium]